MKSKDRNDSSGEKPKDDASQEHKRKQRIPKKGWSPPPFDAFAEADKSRPRRSGRPGERPAGRSFSDKPAFGRGPSEKPAFGDRPKRSFGDKPAFGDRPKRTFNRDEAGSGERPKRNFGDKPAFGDRPKRSFNRDEAGSGERPKRNFGDKPAFGDKPKRNFGDKPAFGDKPKRNFGDKPAFGDKPKRNFGDKPAFGDRPKRNFGDKPAFGDRPKRTFNRDDSRGPSEEPRRKFGRGGVPTEGADLRRPPFNRDEAGGDRPKRNFGDKPAFGDRPKRTFGDKPAFGDRPQRPGFGAAKPGTRKPFDRSERTDRPERPARKPFDRGADRNASNDRPARKSARDSFKGYGPKGIRSRDDEPPRGARSEAKVKAEEVRLNKYIAHSGVCARREADNMIESGKVKVNGKVVTELGTKVSTDDKVTVNDMAIQFEPYKYVLMNKPKNTITTTSDDRGRKTVMDIIENEIGERLYPIGRLDRNTTGVLLLTNDGDLANRLMHPSYTVGKVYQAQINRVLSDAEIEQLKNGVELEDGPARAYHAVRGSMDPYSIELSVHEGRNHLVRRMVEALGAEVTILKRSQFAGLNLDDLRPGRWRFLKTREINTLRTKVKLPELRK
jgi:23S rRNA pseudouridine2605 synthase